MRLRRLACEHCGARAWVDGQCLRCGKLATPATEQAPINARVQPAAIFSRPVVLVAAGLLSVVMLVLLVPTVLGIIEPSPVVLFALILFGFLALARLRPRRKKK
jgi:uncharacterized membrane protein YvbJ